MWWRRVGHKVSTLNRVIAFVCCTLYCLYLLYVVKEPAEVLQFSLAWILRAALPTT